MVAILHPYLLSFNLYRDVLIVRSEKIIIDHETARAFPSLSHLVTGCASHCASLKVMSKTLSAVGLVTFSCEHNERVSVVRMRVSGALKSLGVLLLWTEFVLYCDALGCLSSSHKETREKFSPLTGNFCRLFDSFYETKCKYCFISDSHFIAALYGKTFSIWIVA